VFQLLLCGLVTVLIYYGGRTEQYFTYVLRGWRLPSRTWNHWTSPWMKQLTRLRIIHSGEWCLRLALRTH